MHNNRYESSQPFRFLGLGKIRLGLICIAFVFIGSVLALLAISAVSAHFAYASAKTVPIPPRRPDVMSASPAYIRELMARKSHAGIYDDAFSYDASYGGTEQEYEEELLASLHEVDSQDLLEALQDGADNVVVYKDEDEGTARQEIIYTSRISNSGIPVPGRKPAYGSGSMVQRVEDFSDNPSSVQLAFVEPEVGGYHSDSTSPGEYLLAASPAIRQPIIQPGQTDREKALVSFTLDPNQVSLDPNLKTFLLEHAVKMIKNDPDIRLEIHAYASTENEQEYSDVRRSLARALEVRGFLLEQNIDPSRLKITPMGQDADKATDDRIDLLFIVSKD